MFDPADAPDPDLVYANYLRTCAMLGIEGSGEGNAQCRGCAGLRRQGFVQRERCATLGAARWQRKR